MQETKHSSNSNVAKKAFEMISKSTFFSDVNPQMLDLILQSAATFSLGAKETLIKQDEPFNGLLYVILSGEFWVYRDHKLISKITQNGQVLGEMSVLTNEPRSAEVTANIPSQVVAIDTGFLHKQGTTKEAQLLAFLSVFSRVLTEKLRLTNEKAKLYEDALTDGLTGVFNRRYYDKFIEDQLLKAEHEGNGCSVIMLDVDNFKKYNDTHGHQLGDEVLKGTARVLKEGVRPTDMVARYGGEEFVVVLPITNQHLASLIAEKLRDTLEKAPFPHEETQPLGKVTASFGVATFGENGKTAETLLKNADHCLYLAKEKGRNCVIVASGDITLANTSR